MVFSKRTSISLLIIALFTAIIVAPDSPSVHAQGVPNPLICYAVADNGGFGGGDDRLVAMDRTTGAFIDVGNTLTSAIETMSVDVQGDTVYAVNHTGGIGRLGTLNLLGTPSPGLFVPIGSGIGTGSNAVLGSHPFNDVDSLSFDALTGKLWGITQNSPRNVIFQINPTTGAFIPDAFGPGFDYAEVALGGQPGDPDDVDDLAIDPISGRFFIIASAQNVNDQIREININGFNPAASPGFNPATGQISSTFMSNLIDTATNTPIQDMEGFSTFNNGTFYGTTGAIGTPPNRMWQINPLTGTATTVGDFPQYDDYEAVGCLTAGSNVKSGTVFFDQNSNGIFDEPPDTRVPNITVRFYVDNNNNNVVDGADMLIQEMSSDASGNYVFETARAGAFVVEVDLTDPDFPPGFTLTTSNDQEADFVNTGALFSEWGNSHPNNNFGYRLGTAPPTVPPPNPNTTPVPPGPGGTPGATQVGALTLADPVIGKLADPPFALPGDPVNWVITIRNPGSTAVTGIVVNDTLPAQVEITGVTSSSGSATFTGQSITFIQAALGPGETITITVQTRVRASAVPPYTLRNRASLTNAENPTPRYAEAIVISAETLPDTGDSRWSLWRTPLLILIGIASALAAWIVGRRRVSAP